MKIIGSFICPSQDGDFTLTVEDLEGWFSGACLIKQVGQGQKHEIVVYKTEADKLAKILIAFSKS